MNKKTLKNCIDIDIDIDIITNKSIIDSFIYCANVFFVLCHGRSCMYNTAFINEC